jgi:hypothetical protein
MPGSAMPGSAMPGSAMPGSAISSHANGNPSAANWRFSAAMKANENFQQRKTPTGLFFLTIRVCAKLAI